MGPGDDATQEAITSAVRLGELIAAKDWILLNGGRQQGVMHAVSKGAHSKKGMVIGILPNSDDSDVSEFLDVVIRTDMGQARNNINVLSAQAVIVCGMNPGTASEVALALRAKKKIVMLHTGKEAEDFFTKLGPDLVTVVTTPEEAVDTIENLL